jgi:cold shock protein
MTKPLLKGVLKTWKDDRGFGFISPEHGGRDLFMHISALGESAARPKPGDIVHYQVSRDRQGKLRAINAHIEGAEASSAKSHSSTTNWLKISLIAATVIAAGVAVFFYLNAQNSL